MKIDITKPAELTREQKLNLIYRHTHKDFKGVLEGSGEKSIMTMRDGITCLICLDSMSDEEIADKLDYAIFCETRRLERERIKKVAKQLNEHHERFAAGFYWSTGLCGRYFKARVSDQGELQVYDWHTWTTVPTAQIKFHDHNGRPINLKD